MLATWVNSTGKRTHGWVLTARSELGSNTCSNLHQGAATAMVSTGEWAPSSEPRTHRNGTATARRGGTRPTEQEGRELEKKVVARGASHGGALAMEWSRARPGKELGAEGTWGRRSRESSRLSYGRAWENRHGLRSREGTGEQGHGDQGHGQRG